jgi:hypothetical protein
MGGRGQALTATIAGIRSSVFTRKSFKLVVDRTTKANGQSA